MALPKYAQSTPKNRLVEILCNKWGQNTLFSNIDLTL